MQVAPLRRISSAVITKMAAAASFMRSGRLETETTSNWSGPRGGFCENPGEVVSSAAAARTEARQTAKPVAHAFPIPLPALIPHRTMHLPPPLALRRRTRTIAASRRLSSGIGSCHICQLREKRREPGVAGGARCGNRAGAPRGCRPVPEAFQALLSSTAPLLSAGRRQSPGAWFVLAVPGQALQAGWHLSTARNDQPAARVQHLEARRVRPPPARSGPR